jgi:hypothetical protein
MQGVFMIAEAIKVPDEPILILRFALPSEPLAEAQQLRDYIIQTAPTVEGMLYTISDLSETELTFSDIAVGLNEITKNVIHASQVPEFIPILVGTSAQVKLLSEFAKQEQYGRQELHVYSTLDDALTYVRSHITVH